MDNTFSILQLGLSINPQVLAPLNSSNWIAWSSLIEDLLVHCKYALAVLQGSRNDADIDRQLFTFIHLHVDPSLRHLMHEARNKSGRSGKKAFQMLKTYCAVNQSITHSVKVQHVATSEHAKDAKEEFDNHHEEPYYTEASPPSIKQDSTDKTFTSSDFGDPYSNQMQSSLEAEEESESNHDAATSTLKESRDQEEQQEVHSRGLVGINSQINIGECTAMKHFDDAHLNSSSGLRASQSFDAPPTVRRSVLDVKLDVESKIRLSRWPWWKETICNVVAPCHLALDILTGRIKEGDALYSYQIDVELRSFLFLLASDNTRVIFPPIDSEDGRKGSKAYQALEDTFQSMKRDIRLEVEGLKQEANMSLEKYYDLANHVFQKASQWGISQDEKNKKQLFVKGLYHLYRKRGDQKLEDESLQSIHDLYRSLRSPFDAKILMT